MNFIELVDAIRVSNLEHQQKFIRQIALSRLQFMDQFGAVSINFGRQTGKTSYIIRRATPLDLVIARNRCMADYVISHRPDMADNVIYNFEADKFRGRYAAFQNVYVDDAKFTHKDQAELVSMFPMIQQIVKFGYCD